MFFVIPEMPSKTFVMVLKKLPDHFKPSAADNLESTKKKSAGTEFRSKINVKSYGVAKELQSLPFPIRKIRMKSLLWI